MSQPSDNLSPPPQTPPSHVDGSEDSDDSDYSPLDETYARPPSTNPPSESSEPSSEQSFEDRLQILKENQEDFKEELVRCIWRINRSLENAVEFSPNEAKQYRSLFQIDFEDEWEKMFSGEVTEENIAMVEAQFRRLDRFTTTYLYECEHDIDLIVNIARYPEVTDDWVSARLPNFKNKFFYEYPRVLWKLYNHFPELWGK